MSRNLPYTLIVLLSNSTTDMTNKSPAASGPVWLRTWDAFDRTRGSVYPSPVASPRPGQLRQGSSLLDEAGSGIGHGEDRTVGPSLSEARPVLMTPTNEDPPGRLRPGRRERRPRFQRLAAIGKS